MKVKTVTEIRCLKVESDEDECFNYTRYSANSWWVSMERSEEEVYDCTEIEKAYQEYMVTTGRQIELRPSRCVDCDYYEDKMEAEPKEPPEYLCKKLGKYKIYGKLVPPGDCPLEKI